MYGTYTGYVLGSYGAAVLILGGVLVQSLIARAQARQRLKRIEQVGEP